MLYRVENVFALTQVYIKVIGRNSKNWRYPGRSGTRENVGAVLGLYQWWSVMVMVIYV